MYFGTQGCICRIGKTSLSFTYAKYSGSGLGVAIDNIDFAIPINYVKEIVKRIIEDGYIAKPYIRVSAMDVSHEMQNYGLLIGAAVEAELETNDIITAINGNEISSSKELVEAVSDVLSGDEISLTIYRQRESREIKMIAVENLIKYYGNFADVRDLSFESNGRNISGL